MTDDPLKRLIWFLILLGVWLTFDLTSKQYVFEHVVPHSEGDPGTTSYTLIEGYLWFTHVENRGAVWGMFEKWKHLLFVFNLILTPALLAFFLSSIFYPGFLVDRGNVFFVSALALIMAGAFGNLYDRVAYGFVRDFIHVRIPIVDYHWPVFNVADAGITVGACVLALQMFVNAPEKEDEAPAAEQPS